MKITIKQPELTQTLNYTITEQPRLKPNPESQNLHYEKKSGDERKSRIKKIGSSRIFITSKMGPY